MPVTRVLHIHKTLLFSLRARIIIPGAGREYFFYLNRRLFRDLYVAQLIQGSDLSGSITLYCGAWIFSERAQWASIVSANFNFVPCARLWRKSSSSTSPCTGPDRTGWTFATWRLIFQPVIVRHRMSNAHTDRPREGRDIPTRETLWSAATINQPANSRFLGFSFLIRSSSTVYFRGSIYPGM